MKWFWPLILAFAIVACGGGLSKGSSNVDDEGGDDSGNDLPATTTIFTVTANGTTAYLLNGVSNPHLIFKRGVTYTFNVNASGHPFYLMTKPGTNIANAYSNGVTGNGTSSGTITFTVPSSSPGLLYYGCSNHAAMGAEIEVGF